MWTGVVSGESTCVDIMGCWATCIAVYVRPVTWNVRRRPTSRARARAAMTALLPPRTSAAPHVSMRRTSAALDVSVAASAASSPKKQATRAFIMAVLLLSTRALQRMCESTLIPRMVTVESDAAAHALGRAPRAAEGALAGGAPSACPRARLGAARRGRTVAGGRACTPCGSPWAARDGFSALEGEPAFSRRDRRRARARPARAPAERFVGPAGVALVDLSPIDGASPALYSSNPSGVRCSCAGRRAAEGRQLKFWKEGNSNFFVSLTLQRAIKRSALRRRGSPCRRRAFCVSSSATRRGPARGHPSGRRPGVYRGAHRRPDDGFSAETRAAALAARGRRAEKAGARAGREDVVGPAGVALVGSSFPSRA